MQSQSSPSVTTGSLGGDPLWETGPALRHTGASQSTFDPGIMSSVDSPAPCRPRRWGYVCSRSPRWVPTSSSPSRREPSPPGIAQHSMTCGERSSGEGRSSDGEVARRHRSACALMRPACFFAKERLARHQQPDRGPLPHVMSEPRMVTEVAAWKPSSRAGAGRPIVSSVGGSPHARCGGLRRITRHRGNASCSLVPVSLFSERTSWQR